MEKEEALALWDAIYGKNNEWQTDCFGTWMYRNDYGDIETMRKRPGGDGKNYSYGWEIDHIRPKSNFKNESDANFYNNYEPMWWNHNREKADNYPQFTIDDRTYSVVRCDICSKNGLLGYGITDKNGNRIDWKAKKVNILHETNKQNSYNKKYIFNIEDVVFVSRFLFYHKN